MWDKCPLPSHQKPARVPAHQPLQDPSKCVLTDTDVNTTPNTGSEALSCHVKFRFVQRTKTATAPSGGSVVWRLEAQINEVGNVCFRLTRHRGGQMCESHSGPCQLLCCIQTATKRDVNAAYNSNQPFISADWCHISILRHMLEMKKSDEIYQMRNDVDGFYGLVE